MATTPANRPASATSMRLGIGPPLEMYRGPSPGPRARGYISLAASVRERRLALLEVGADRFLRSDALQAHDLLAVLVFDCGLLRDLERGPHPLLRQPDAPRSPGG